MAVILLRHNQEPIPPWEATLDASHPLSRGLTGMWYFKQGGGAVVEDKVGRRRATATNGATWTANRGVGMSGRVDGTNDLWSIETPHRFAVVLTNWTVLIRLRWDVNNVTRVVLDANNWRCAGSTGIRFTEPGVADYDSRPFSAIPAGVYNWGWVKLGDAGANMSFYINGIIETQTATVGSTGAAATTMALGAKLDGSEGITGNIEGLWLYERALSVSEIKAHNAYPYANLILPPRKVWAPAAAAGGFQPAWAGGANRLIGGGVIGG